MLATETYTQVTGWGDLRMAAALSTALLLPCLALFLAQRYAVERRGSYATITGKVRGDAAQAPIESVTLSGDQGVFTLTRGSSTVGRAPEATMRIDSREVSRVHAVVHVSEKDVVVEDRGSVNGSSINGTQFTGNRAIEDGDRVSFADFEFRVAIKRTEGNS